jgi:hypothetical protein
MATCLYIPILPTKIQLKTEPPKIGCGDEIDPLYIDYPHTWFDNFSHEDRNRAFVAKKHKVIKNQAELIPLQAALS